MAEVQVAGILKEEVQRRMAAISQGEGERETRGREGEIFLIRRLNGDLMAQTSDLPMYADARWWRSYSRRPPECIESMRPSLHCSLRWLSRMSSQAWGILVLVEILREGRGRWANLRQDRVWRRTTSIRGLVPVHMMRPRQARLSVRA